MNSIVNRGFVAAAFVAALSSGARAVDKQAYLFWGNHGGDPGLWYAELKDNMIELAGEIKPVPGLLDPAAFGQPLSWPNNCGKHRRGSPQTNFVEAPWIYKVGDTYYLEYASGGLPEKWSYSTSSATPAIPTARFRSSFRLQKV